MSCDNLDLPRLREHFATLFDRAAAAVQRAGYDLDHVILDRFLICQSTPGRKAEVPIEFLSRPDHIRRQIAHAVRDAPSPAHIIALCVRVWLDRPT